MVITDLNYKPIPGKPFVQLLNDMTYFLGVGLSIVVPKGFKTNLTSIPTWLQWFWPPDGPYVRAAVLHDYLYRDRRVRRKVADVLFYDALKTLDIPLPTRVIFYLYVRLMGWRKY